MPFFVKYCGAKAGFFDATHDYTEFEAPAFDGPIIRGLDLSQNAIDKICVTNYDKFVGNIVPVKMDEVKERAEKMLSDIKKGEDFEKKERCMVWLGELLKK